MNPLTKTYVSIGLMLIAMFEFWSAMEVFGKKPPSPKSKVFLRLHRIFGYFFLVYWVWISWVCFNLMSRLAEAGEPLNNRGLLHGALAIALFMILIFKIFFVRSYRQYRPAVPAMGIILVGGTFVVWGIAGLMFIILL